MSHHALMFGVANNSVQRSPGAHRIATVLREHEWDVEVIDYTALWSLAELQELVRSRVTGSTVFFGFSTIFSSWDPSLNAFTRWLKDTYPNIKIVIGGNSVALTNAENIDYWVDGYGEVAAIELARSLTGNTGPALRFDMEQFGTRRLIKATTSYPAYPMPSYRTLYEARDFMQPFEWGTMELSRGCKFTCKFCAVPLLGVKEDQSVPAEDFEYALRYNYDNFGIQNYYITDETFNDRSEKIEKYAQVVERMPFRPFFSGYLRLDVLTAHPEMRELLVRMNYGGHQFGIETFNHASGKVVGKGMNPERVKSALLDNKEYFKSSALDFYRCNLSFIVGLPYETRETQMATIDWLDVNWQDQSAGMAPLYIANAKSRKEHTKISDFGEDLRKHGLRELSSNVTWPELHYPINRPNNNEHSFLWEHDTMNIVEAYELASLGRDRIVPVTRMDNWMLHLPFFKQQGTVSWDSVEPLKKRDWYDNTGLLHETGFVRRYIDSKLNL